MVVAAEEEEEVVARVAMGAAERIKVELTKGNVRVSLPWLI